MADTIRKQILDSLIAHIEASDFVTQNALTLTPGKTRFKIEDLPGLSFFARTEEGGIDRYGRQVNSLEVEISYAGIIDRGPDDEKTSILDAIEAVRGKMQYVLVTATLDDLADPPVYTGGDIEYPSAEDMAFTCSVLGQITYETRANDPYSQE